jgi:cell shape-determining protein MreD
MLTLTFALATAALILQSVLCPPFTLLPFAPWIALVSLRCPFSKTLLLVAAAGAGVDLLSDDPMGLHAINFCLTAGILFRVRNHFLYDNPFHLSLFTTLISCASTLIQIFLLFLFDRRVPFAGKWVLGDLLAMPIADGLYALVWFAAPLLLYEKLRRHVSVYWRKNAI